MAQKTLTVLLEILPKGGNAFQAAIGTAVKGAGFAGASALGGLAGLATGGIGMAIGAAGAGIKTSVGARSPATMERFERALMDVTAVIGETLMPVIEFWTAEIRLVGDVLASILPSAEEVREVLAPLHEGLSELRSVLADVAPVIKDVIFLGFQAMGWVLKQVVHYLKEFAAWLGYVNTGQQLRSSVGFAATSARFASGEDISKAASAAAFGAGAVNHQQQTAKNTKSMAETLERILTNTFAIFLRMNNGNIDQAYQQAKKAARVIGVNIGGAYS